MMDDERRRNFTLYTSSRKELLPVELPVEHGLSEAFLRDVSLFLMYVFLALFVGGGVFV